MGDCCLYVRVAEMDQKQNKGAPDNNFKCMRSLEIVRGMWCRLSVGSKRRRGIILRSDASRAVFRPGVPRLVDLLSVLFHDDADDDQSHYVLRGDLGGADRNRKQQGQQTGIAPERHHRHELVSVARSRLCFAALRAPLCWAPACVATTTTGWT